MKAIKLLLLALCLCGFTYRVPDTYDLFDRANEALETSADWTTVVGSLTVKDNHVESDSTDSALFDYVQTMKDGWIEWDANHEAGATFIGVVFRWASGSYNGYYVGTDSSTGVVDFGKLNTGSPTEITTAGTITTNTTYNVKVHVTGANPTVVQVYLDNVLAINNSADSDFDVSGNVGWFWSGLDSANVGYADNLKTWDDD